MLTDVLKEAIRRRCLFEPMHRLARRCGVDPGNLSRFIRNKRGLRLPAVERLCAELGLSIARDHESKSSGESVTQQLRKLLHNTDMSLRNISYRAGIDPGNLSAFIHEHRDLGAFSIDALCHVLRLVVVWHGKLAVKILVAGKARPRANVAVECVCILTVPERARFSRGVKITNAKGTAVFPGIPIGATAEIRAGGCFLDRVEMVDDAQEFAIEI